MFQSGQTAVAANRILEGLKARRVRTNPDAGKRAGSYICKRYVERSTEERYQGSIQGCRQGMV